MEAPIKTRYDKAGPQVAEALRRRHFEAHYVSTAQEALELALTLIPKDRTVSWGGTATAAQIGLMDCTRGTINSSTGTPARPPKKSRP
jgi:hypothetical protein